MPGLTRRVPPLGPATAGEVFLLEWGRESFKATTPLLNDVLGKALTLATALTGGGLALLDKAVMTEWGKVGMLTLFVGSIGACLVGLIPKGGGFVTAPEAIRSFETATIRRKRSALVWAGSLLIAGFVIGIVGVVARGRP